MENPHTKSNKAVRGRKRLRFWQSFVRPTSIIFATMRRYGKNHYCLVQPLWNSPVGGRPSLLPDQSPPPDEEIPRYPPFMKGLPAAPVERILSTQVDLIQAIEHALSLPDDLYQTIAAPVIAVMRFQPFVAASESHHHRGAGGLFRHGLEVAHWATQAHKAVCLLPRPRPENARNKNCVGVWRCVLPVCCMT